MKTPQQFGESTGRGAEEEWIQVCIIAWNLENMIFGRGHLQKATSGQRKKENPYLSQEQKVVLENTQERER